jgi:hypothetical protein
MWILTGLILYWPCIKKIDTSGELYIVHYTDGKTEKLNAEQTRELHNSIHQMVAPRPAAPGSIPLIG